MLYHLLYPLHEFFGYITVRTGAATICAFLASMLLGPPMIKWLRKKQIGQMIRSDGPESHASKAGTPTMGGVLIIMTTAVASLLFVDLKSKLFWGCFVVMILFGLIGFIDDWMKISKANSKGLSGKLRLLMEFMIGGLFVMYLIHFTGFPTELQVPFFKQVTVDFSWWYIPFGMIVIAGASNAVNLTDGLDGLAIAPVAIAAAAFAVTAYIVGSPKFAKYLLITPIPGSTELAIFLGAIFGAGLGFLWFNSHPAEIFMGDVGALSLGGALGSCAVATKQEFTLLIVGGLFVMEAVSVILQVGSFKLTGRRIFRMAPLHHHFELSGWPEPKVIVRFWILAVIFAMVALGTLKVR